MSLTNFSLPLPAPTFIPTPTYLFSARVTLGKSLGPISLLEGGKRVVEIITGGVISGPGFNATIEGGAAAPVVVVDDVSGSKYQVPYVLLSSMFHPCSLHFRISSVEGVSADLNDDTRFIYAYGTASDGSPFYMEEAGIGRLGVQNTRLIINVGGEYEQLQSLYILGQPSLNDDKTLASVECFSVPLPAQ